MVSRHERAVSRKSRDGKKKTGSGSSSSDSAQEGPGGESECEEGVRDEVRAGQNDDAGDDEVRRAPIVHEPRPSVGVEGDGGVEERDWSRVSVEERLSAAGAAPVTADRSAGAVSGGVLALRGLGACCTILCIILMQRSRWCIGENSIDLSSSCNPGKVRLSPMALMAYHETNWMVGRNLHMTLLHVAVEKRRRHQFDVS